MDRIAPDLRSEFDRWCKQIPSEGPGGADMVTIRDALRAHVLLVDAFREMEGEKVGGVGPRNMSLLASAIDRQHVGLGNSAKWSNIFERTATTFFGMVKNHPFYDGNKRTGLLLALWQLYRARRVPSVPQKNFEQLAVATAASTLHDFDPKRFTGFCRKRHRPDADVLYIADRLRAWTREEDREFYIVTFSELNRLLHRFKCRLANPDGNYIDVLQTKMKRQFLIGRQIPIEYKVLDIGFPGWKAEVPMSTIKKVRVATGLTREQGIDSKVFFKEFEPMQSLIDVFYEPLRRLADK